MHTTLLTLSDFDFDLPDARIAQTPPATRGASRLLHVDPAGALADLQFSDLPGLLNAGDLLVFNDTRVIKARLAGHKASGGKIEVLVERITEPDRVLAHVRASKPPGAGTVLRLADAFDAVVLGRAGELFDIRFPGDVLSLLDAFGATPLPPYITHAADSQDDERYQTVYSDAPGAVAAPTAGLHFDSAMLQQLEQAGVGVAFVTLHVGAGTFQPVRTQDISQHIMHAERYTVPTRTQEAVVQARRAGKRVIAVGTTSIRALESAALSIDTDMPAAGPTPFGKPRYASDQTLTFHQPQGDTRLFISPGFNFQIVDAVVTNFHLPQSTLLMLVSALAGVDTIRAAYAHAIEQQYRFFSYGDAMFIEPSRHAI